MARTAPTEEQESPKPPKTPFDEDTRSTYAAQSDKKLRALLVSYTEEYQLLAPDQSQAAISRRVQVMRVLRAIQDVLDAREELVEVTVPRSVTGEPFIIGPRTFPPGRYALRSSVASYLLWLIGKNQEVELRRLQQNGREIDLGTIGSRARQIHETITRNAG